MSSEQFTGELLSPLLSSLFFLVLYHSLSVHFNAGQDRDI